MTDYSLFDCEVHEEDSSQHIKPGTPQQEAFWARLLSEDSHITLSARAGTGKSFSARQAMHRISKNSPDRIQVYCCFNNAIAAEFRPQCPDGVDVRTINSLGNQIVTRAFRSNLDNLKTYKIIDQVAGRQWMKKTFRKAIYDTVARAKSQAILPNQKNLEQDLETLIYTLGIDADFREREAAQMAAKVLRLSAEETSIHDFADQIWMPVVHNLKGRYIDDLYIDEAQDLDPCQHAFVRQLNPHRVIPIGDPFQAIYAFRGADSNSIQRLTDQLGADIMPLTMTWRCPRSHVEQARQLVSDFECASDAKEGTILESTYDQMVMTSGPGDLVICRVNSPIVKACLKKIANGERANVRGRNVGADLKTTLNKITKKETPSDAVDLITLVEDYRSREYERLSVKDESEQAIGAMYDKCDCLLAIIESCQNNISEIDSCIDHLFSDDLDARDRTTFSSVHRAKGSEAEKVFFVDVPYSAARDRRKPPKPWELEQRRNLRYVALTRSLSELVMTGPPRDM